jgi:DNA polymerase-1
VDSVGYENVPLNLMVPYAVSDAYVTLETNMQLEYEMKKQLLVTRKGPDIQQIFDLEMDYLWVVFSKEERGMRVDRDYIGNKIGELTPVLEENKTRMRSTLGWDINPLSTDDVAEALRSQGIDGSSWVNKRTGRDKLPEWVLQDLIDSPLTTESVRQLCSDVLEYRSNTKLLTTYFQPLLRQMIVDDKGEAIIHPNVKQHGARTGRQSITDPPLQTLPRDKGGVREAFIARDGFKLIFCDYSQQELRLLAHYMSAIGYDEMTEIYRRGGDVHWETAESVFGKPRDQLKKSVHRQRAKDVNFGTVYGMGVEKAAMMLAGDIAKGKQFLNKYHRTFPGIRALKRECEKRMAQRGFIVTTFGRRHRLKNSNLAYKAVNSLIQGSGADLTKWAMVRINSRFVSERMESRILLSIHDEIICESPNDEVEVAASLIPEVMCSFKLMCPLEAEVSVGDRWTKE